MIRSLGVVGTSLKKLKLGIVMVTYSFLPVTSSNPYRVRRIVRVIARVSIRRLRLSLKVNIMTRL